jgi:hypothetical protein
LSERAAPVRLRSSHHTFVEIGAFGPDFAKGAARRPSPHGTDRPTKLQIYEIEWLAAETGAIVVGKQEFEAKHLAIYDKSSRRVARLADKSSLKMDFLTNPQ